MLTDLTLTDLTSGGTQLAVEARPLKVGTPFPVFRLSWFLFLPTLGECG